MLYYDAWSKKHQIVFYALVTPLGRNSLTLNGGFVYVVPVTSTFAIKISISKLWPSAKNTNSNRHYSKEFEPHM